MDITLFIYNIFLIILYTCAIVYSFHLNVCKKQPLYLAINVMFVLFVLDNVIIYMTEFFDKFSSFYDLQFMTIPSFKTLIMMSIVIVYFLIQKYTLNKSFTTLDYLMLALLSICVLFIPLALNGALMVWSYYLPYQLITIYLSLVGLKYIKSNSNLLNKNPYMNLYKKILKYTLIFSFLIIIEDTIVIFSFDVYSDILVKINNRSVSEDILTIIYAVYAIKYCSSKINSLLKVENNVSNETKNIDFIGSAFYEFVQHYNLTNREQDILKLLLQNKNNQEISENLFISIGTVKTHIHNIFQKVDVSKRNMLIDIYKEFDSDISNITSET